MAAGPTKKKTKKLLLKFEEPNTTEPRANFSELGCLERLLLILYFESVLWKICFLVLVFLLGASCWGRSANNPEIAAHKEALTGGLSGLHARPLHTGGLSCCRAFYGHIWEETNT